MKYYINGIEKTRKEMKLKYYKEQYRFTLLRIFITKLLKKYSLGIKFTIIAVLSIFAFVSLINSPVEAQEVVEEEKTVLEQLIEEAPEVLIEEDKNNYEKFMEEGERIHEEKKKAYKEVEEKAFEFIVQFEGYHDKPYWDIRQYSCGYGMRCSKNTTGITKSKSKWFVMERIKHIREANALYKYDDNMEVALISFIYNIGSAPVGMEWYIENGYINALKNMMRKYQYGGGKILRGLTIRRNAEVNLF